MADDHQGESLMEKISDKINNHDSSSLSDDEKKKEKISPSSHFPPPEVMTETENDSATVSAAQSPSSPSSSALNSSKSKIYRFLNRQQPIHKVLGGGKPADVFLWRNKKTSATVLGVATLIWFFFEVLEYHLLTLICHVLIFVLALFFLWSKASKFIHKAPPRIPEVHIPENTLLEFSAAARFEINRALHVLRDIACGKNLKRFLQVIGGLWIVSIVAGWFNFLTLVYLMFVLLHTVPLFYEKYEHQVDTVAEKGMIELRKHYAVVNAKVLSKIPKEPLKDKKFD